MLLSRIGRPRWIGNYRLALFRSLLYHVWISTNVISDDRLPGAGTGGGLGALQRKQARDDEDPSQAGTYPRVNGPVDGRPRVGDADRAGHGRQGRSETAAGFAEGGGSTFAAARRLCGRNGA